MREMAWFMGAWLTLRHLCDLRVRSLEETWQFVLESNNHDIGLSFLSLAKRDMLGTRARVMKSIADRRLAFIPSSCITALGQIDTVRHILLADLFWLVLTMFDGE